MPKQWFADILPSTTTVIADEAEDGLLLATVHVCCPAVVTVRVWMYCAVTGSFNTVWVPWVTVVESLVQVTVVAGPPVEIQVRVSWLGSNVTPPDIETPPKTHVWHVIPASIKQVEKSFLQNEGGYRDGQKGRNKGTLGYMKPSL